MRLQLPPVFFAFFVAFATVVNPYASGAEPESSCAVVFEKLKPDSSRFGKWTRRGFLGLALAGTSYAGLEAISTEPTTVTLSPPAAKTGTQGATPRISQTLEVALIGDSLSRDFHLSGPTSMLWSMRTHNQGGWFLDASPQSAGPEGFLERIAKTEGVSILGTNYSTVSAYIDEANVEKSPLKECIGNVCSLSEQVGQVLNQRKLPDLTLLWIGHNNLDWISFQNPPETFPALADQISNSYRLQLQRLVNAAKLSPNRHAIVVFGLINFRAFFQARDQAETEHNQNPNLYPYLETGYEIFPSMRPGAREEMIALADLLNQKLRDVVRSFQADLSDSMKMVYSDAFSSVAIHSAEFLNAEDGWHASAIGQDALAEAAFRDLLPTIRFLEKKKR